MSTLAELLASLTEDREGPWRGLGDEGSWLMVNGLPLVVAALEAAQAVEGSAVKVECDPDLAVWSVHSAALADLRDALDALREKGLL